MRRIMHADDLEGTFEEGYLVMKISDTEGDELEVEFDILQLADFLNHVQVPMEVNGQRVTSATWNAKENLLSIDTT